MIKTWNKSVTYICNMKLYPFRGIIIFGLSKSAVQSLCKNNRVNKRFVKVKYIF